jgi:G3E family GTPase
VDLKGLVKQTYLTIFCTTKRVLRVAVIINDMIEVNMDAEFVKNDN